MQSCHRCQSTTSSSPTSWGRSSPSRSLVTGATEAEPAVGTTSQQERRGRETAGLPQGGETPLGSRFFKHWDFCKSLSPLSLFLGAEILGLLYVGKFVILVKTTTWTGRQTSKHVVKRKIKCKSFVTISIIASRGQRNWTNNLEWYLCLWWKWLDDFDDQEEDCDDEAKTIRNTLVWISC